MDTAITVENDYQLVQLSMQKKAKLEAKRFQLSQTTPNLSFEARIQKVPRPIGKDLPQGIKSYAMKQKVIVTRKSSL
jgi:hypothetical protein